MCFNIFFQLFIFAAEGLETPFGILFDYMEYKKSFLKKIKGHWFFSNTNFIIEVLLIIVEDTNQKTEQKEMKIYCV